MNLIIGRPKGTAESETKILKKYPKLVKMIREYPSLKQMDFAVACNVDTKTVKKVRDIFEKHKG